MRQFGYLLTDIDTNTKTSFWPTIRLQIQRFFTVKARKVPPAESVLPVAYWKSADRNLGQTRRGKEGKNWIYCTAFKPISYRIDTNTVQKYRR